MQEMQKTQIRSLGQEDLLGQDMTTPSNSLTWKIPYRGDWQDTVHRFAESGMTEVTEHANMNSTSIPPLFMP